MSNDVAIAVKMTRAACHSLIAATNELCALDAVAGDGDHGFAMATASKAILAKIDVGVPADLQALFNMIGLAFSNVGGSMGALIFVAADAVAGEVSRAPSLQGSAAAIGWLTAAQSAITDLGGARPGDKTMVDALDAARATFAAAKTDEPVARTLRQAADAARAAANETSNMAAKIGRASRLPDVARGSADAGATSFAIAMDALSTQLSALAEGR